VSTVYDTGVIIAADRNDRRVWADHRARLEAGVVPVTTAPVVAQASRSPRQVQVRRFLRGCDVVGFDADDAHGVGALLAKTATADVVDAHVALTASRTTGVLITSDPDDLQVLAAHVRPRITLRTTPS
jgi:predicted nucleic acid-binding protein